MSLIQSSSSFYFFFVFFISFLSLTFFIYLIYSFPPLDLKMFFLFSVLVSVLTSFTIILPSAIIHHHSSIHPPVHQSIHPISLIDKRIFEVSPSWLGCTFPLKSSHGCALSLSLRLFLSLFLSDTHLSKTCMWTITFHPHLHSFTSFPASLSQSSLLSSTSAKCSHRWRVVIVGGRDK